MVGPELFVITEFDCRYVCKSKERMKTCAKIEEVRVKLHYAKASKRHINFWIHFLCVYRENKTFKLVWIVGISLNVTLLLIIQSKNCFLGSNTQWFETSIVRKFRFFSALQISCLFNKSNNININKPEQQQQKQQLQQREIYQSATNT